MTFYFYDYETFGANPKTARIAQFAGIRTDENLNIIDEKTLYCKPSFDSLIDPVACNITGISPKICLEKGLIERDFIKNINQELATFNTCTVGYNNIRFDDEITRYTLYRNFFDPYAWSWQGGNSRWDLLDVVRMCYALKPGTLKFDFDEVNGVKIPSFKLDRLAPSNNIVTKSHDALEDVRTTIKIAQIIKKQEPKLFDYALSLRDKKVVKDSISLFSPMLHTSGMYPANLGCTRRVVSLGLTDIGNFIVFNLDQDPSIILDLEVDELRALQFSKTEDLPSGCERLQIKELHPNKSPMFVPGINKLDVKISTHLKIDMDKTNKHLDFILANKDAISNKVQQLYKLNEYPKNQEVEQSLYDGFLSPSDRNIASTIIDLNKTELITFNPDFSDDKLNKLFILFKARNYPEILNEQDQELWFDVVQQRVQEGKHGYLSIAEFESSLKDLQQKYPEKTKLWQDLIDYTEQIV